MSKIEVSVLEGNFEDSASLQEHVAEVEAAIVHAGFTPDVTVIERTSGLTPPAYLRTTHEYGSEGHFDEHQRAEIALLPFGLRVE